MILNLEQRRKLLQLVLAAREGSEEEVDVLENREKRGAMKGHVGKQDGLEVPIGGLVDCLPLFPAIALHCQHPRTIGYFWTAPA